MNLDFREFIVKIGLSFQEDNNTRVLFERILSSNDLPKEKSL